MTTIKGTRVIAKGNVTGNYITIPCQIYNYIQLGLITNTDLSVYGYLLDRYNIDYGYAYPSITYIMIHESAGLIEIGKASKGNNVYRVFLPLEREELYKLVPGLVEEFEQHRKDLLSTAIQDKIRWNTDLD